MQTCPYCNSDKIQIMDEHNDELGQKMKCLICDSSFWEFGTAYNDY